MNAPMKILRTEAEMVEAYRQRIRELGITYATVDAISGLPDGYCAKLMSPNPMRGLGEKAIEGLNGALGIGFAVRIDDEQVEKVRARWVKRRRQIDKKKQVASASRLSIETGIQITAESSEQMAKRERMKLLGKLGGKASAKRRMKTMGKRRRQRIASHAARMRWAKRATAAAMPV